MKRESRVYLVRHAQSANNALPESQRVSDPGLTNVGQMQAQRLAEWVRHLGAPRIFCSAFRRSLDTAAAIHQAANWKPSIRADLFEKGGCYAGFPPNPLIPQPGKSSTELASEYPGWEIDPRITERGWWHGKEYESEDHARDRAKAVERWMIQDVLPKEIEIVLVIHADFKRLLIEQMFPELRRWSRWADPNNASITRVTLDQDGWHLDWLNAVSHLPTEWIT